MLDVVHRSGERALGHADDTVVNFLRNQTVVVPDNADHRNVDVGENVGRSVKDRQGGYS